MTATIARINLKQVSAHVRERVEFDCNGTVRGTRHLGDKGQLPVAYWSELTTAAQADDFYVVRSYITPIAWFANGVWYVPNVRYSVTTSRHQSALGLVTDGSAWRESRDVRAWAYCGKGS